jgi:hypothetical protein
MTTSVLHQNDYRFEHLFFSGMALVILVFVFVGFAPTYYLAGVFRAPLPNLLVHVHGAAFSLWILLLIAQTSLVAVGRVDLHRRLGLFGFGLACLMVVLGLLVATDSLIRHASNAERATAIRAFYANPLGAMLVFGTLDLLCISQPAESRDAQTTHFYRHPGALGCCSRPLADSGGLVDESNGELGGLLPVSAVDGRLRLVVHEKDSTSNALGRRVPGGCAASSSSDRTYTCFSEFCCLDTDSRTSLPLRSNRAVIDLSDKITATCRTNPANQKFGIESLVLNEEGVYSPAGWFRSGCGRR